MPLCAWCDSKAATRPDGLCPNCGKLKDDMGHPPKPPKNESDMNQPAQLVDTGNTLLTPSAARLDTGVATNTDGTRTAVMTIRTPTTTLTIMLTPGNLREWAALVSKLDEEVNGKLAAASPLDVNAMNQALARFGKGRA